MHLTFAPALCQTTTVPLPPLAEGATHYDLKFKATFDSPASYNHAIENGIRVEMWTDLPVAGSDEGWCALAFRSPDEYRGNAQSSAGLMFSCVPPKPSAADAAQELAVYSKVQIPIASVHDDGTMYSFTYRLVHPSGDMQWLGAFGQNGILRFEKRDVRAQFVSDITAVGNSVVLKGETERDVGSLSRGLVWERWAIGQNGVSYATTFTAPASRTVILLPRSLPNSHSIVPLEPVILTVDAPTSALSINASGAVIFHPDAFPASTSEAGTFGESRWSLGDTTRLLQYDTESGTALLASAHDGYPLTLSIIPIKEVPLGTAVCSARIPAKDLSLLFPSSSDFVLFHKGTTNYLPISPSLVDEVITIQVASSGGQVLLTPLFSISPANEETSPVQLGLISHHSKIELVPAFGAASILPTPPPSPPVESVSLHEDRDSGEATQGTAPAQEENKLNGTPNENATATRSSAATSTLDILGPQVSNRATPASTVPSSPNIASGHIVTSVGLSRPGANSVRLRSIVGMSVEHIMRALWTRFFGIFWLVLARIGLKAPEKPVEPAAHFHEDVSEDTGIDDVEERAVVEEAQEDLPHSSSQGVMEGLENVASSPVEEVPQESDETRSDITAVDRENDEKTEKPPVVSYEGPKATKTTASASRPAYFSADVIGQAVALLVRSPLSETKPSIPNISVKLDDQVISQLPSKVLSKIDSETEMATFLIEFGAPASGGKVEITLN